MECYKLVMQCYDGKYSSLTYIGQTSYRKNQRTVRKRLKQGPFATFATVEDVMNFSRQFGWVDACLFKVRITKSKSRTMWQRYQDVLQKFLDNHSNKIPEGTIFADAVTLLEEIPGWSEEIKKEDEAF